MALHVCILNNLIFIDLMHNFIVMFYDCVKYIGFVIERFLRQNRVWWDAAWRMLHRFAPAVEKHK
jgi:hypothetical protein